jgi:hypothetical protein
MTDQQFREHVRLLEAISGETRGVQQELERLNQIANANLQQNGESKEVLVDILRALEK